ncbi:hypothetical protein, partial [Providencia stuartii]|uniref:hypothetical protein n=1 Tax=Providencia stuartii TaxID=588 RepID=UPI003D2C65A2
FGQSDGITDVDWLKMLPIMEGKYTGHDLRTTATLGDVLDFHEAYVERLLSQQRAEDGNRRTSRCHRSGHHSGS